MPRHRASSVFRRSSPLSLCWNILELLRRYGTFSAIAETRKRRNYADKLIPGSTSLNSSVKQQNENLNALHSNRREVCKQALPPGCARGLFRRAEWFASRPAIPVCEAGGRDCLQTARQSPSGVVYDKKNGIEPGEGSDAVAMFYEARRISPSLRRPDSRPSRGWRCEAWCAAGRGC